MNRRDKLPRFAGLRDGDLMRVARTVTPWDVVELACLLAVGSVIIFIGMVL